jgi:hypothetical protein
MATRLMKNLPTTGYDLSALGMYAYLRTVLGLTVIDAVGTWDLTSFGGDGSVLVTAPNTFTVGTANTFLAGHVGWFLAVRDPNNSLNSGVYVITAVSGDGASCTLMAPVGTFVANGTGLLWSLHDNTNLPAVNDRFVVARSGSLPTSWNLQVMVGASGVLFRISPRGGYDTVSHAFTGVVLTEVVLAPIGPDTPALTFACGDETAGWVTFWLRTAAPIPVIVSLGEYHALHATGVPGTPQDDVNVAAFGATVPSDDSCNSDSAVPDTITQNCYMLDHDKITVVQGRIAQYSMQGSFTDIMDTAGYLTNPRTGQGDDYPAVFGLPAAVTTKQIRGVVKGLRLVHRAHPVNTLLSSGAVLALRDGIGVPWDATVPV